MSYNLGIALLVAILSYLLGAISFARLITRRFSSGKDVAQIKVPVPGTGEKMQVTSIGANAASIELGAQGGMLVGLLDILKVAIPSLACKLIFPNLPYYTLLAGLAGMAGHNWPIYYRFHGGVGFSAAMGSLLVVDWLAVIVLPISGTLFGMLVRNLVVASLSWLWLLIPWMWFRTQDWVYVIYAVALNILFILAMIPEAKMAIHYWKEGKLHEYGESVLLSTPMGRGMVKMASYFKFSIRPE